jgi:transposase InsO family protein
VHRANFGVYGIEKVWRQLNREGTRVGRDRVARLMDELDLEGIVRGKRKRVTTWPATSTPARPIWSSGTSRLLRRTACGLPT